MFTKILAIRQIGVRSGFYTRRNGAIQLYIFMIYSSSVNVLKNRNRYTYFLNRSFYSRTWKLSYFTLTYRKLSFLYSSENKWNSYEYYNNPYNLVQQSIIFFVVWSLSNHFEFHDKESIELLSYDVTFAVFTTWNRINYVIGYLFCMVISITLLCQKLNISC